MVRLSGSAGSPAALRLGGVSSADLAELHLTSKRIGRAVWGVALGVMVYGAINVTTLLILHGVYWMIAPFLSIMVDLGMCIGLWGERVLHQYGVRDGWVGALRWTTLVMTLLLNIAGPALAGDVVGIGIHAFGPVLLLVVAEGAGRLQSRLREIISAVEAALDQQAAASRRPVVSAAVSVGAAGQMRDVSVGDVGTGGDERGRLGIGAGRSGVSISPGPDESGGRWAGLDVSPAQQVESREVVVPGRGMSVAPTAGSVDGAALAVQSPAPTRTIVRVIADPERSADADGAATRAGAAVSEVVRVSESLGSGLDCDETGTSGIERPEAALQRGISMDPLSDVSVSRDSGDGAESLGGGGGPVGGTARRRMCLDGDAPRGAKREPETAKSVMWEHWKRCRAAGAAPSGAELDEVAGTSNYGRAVLRSWHQEGQITADELAMAQRAARDRRRSGARVTVAAA